MVKTQNQCGNKNDLKYNLRQRFEDLSHKCSEDLPATQMNGKATELTRV